MGANVSTYLLTWNPRRWNWHDIEEVANRTRSGRAVHEGWSCGRTKRIVPSDRVFLLKQGQELPNGIVASGRATSRVRPVPHWDDRKVGKRSLHIDVQWDTILNPEIETPLSVSYVPTNGLFVNWNTASSGISIPAEVADRLEGVWLGHVAAIRNTSQISRTHLEDLDEEFPEGRVLYRLHRSRERSSVLVRRAKAIALQRTGALTCEVCGFSFFSQYGRIGKDFIECHHTVPISELTSRTKTKLKDLALVCSNCHRMLHRRRPWLKAGDLKRLLKNR